MRNTNTQQRSVIATISILVIDLIIRLLVGFFFGDYTMEPSIIDQSYPDYMDVTMTLEPLVHFSNNFPSIIISIEQCFSELVYRSPNIPKFLSHAH